MKVLLVRHYRPDAQRSMLEFGQALNDYLSTTSLSVRSLEPQARLGKGKNTMSGKAKLLGYMDKFVLFPSVLKKAAAEVDVVHFCGQIHALYIPKIGGKPCVITCHDLLAGKASIGENAAHTVGKGGQKLQAMMWENLPKANRIACVSSATLKDLEKYIKVRPGQGSVVWNGVYEPIQKMDDTKAILELKGLGVDPSAKYLFHLGGNQFYKNRAGVASIFAELKKRPEAADLKLIMAGKPLPTDLKEHIEKLNIGKDLQVLVDVTYDQKLALYSRAYALLYPSTAEGFGLPLVEAQLCGCPVITSDISPMNEIVAETGILIDPADVTGAANKIAENVDRLSRLIAPGYLNAKRFELARMGEDYVKLYKSLVA